MASFNKPIMTIINPPKTVTLKSLSIKLNNDEGRTVPASSSFVYYHITKSEVIILRRAPEKKKAPTLFDRNKLLGSNQSMAILAGIQTKFLENTN